MNRIFEMKIIQPKFDETYKEYEEKNKINVLPKGIVDKRKGIQIGNKKEKEGFWSRFFWKYIIQVLVLVTATLFLYYKFGIK